MADEIEKSDRTKGLEEDLKETEASLRESRASDYEEAAQKIREDDSND